MRQLLLFLCFLYTCNASAQTVFAPPGAVWHFENIPDLEPPGQNYIRYAVEKDTMLYGHLCSKIPGKRIQVNKDQNGYDTLEQETQYTYTSGDTVFYYNQVFSRFLVLYNFDVKVGDTVTYHVPYIVTGPEDTTFQIEIKKIETVTVDGIPLRIIYSRSLIKSQFEIRAMIERGGSFSAVEFIGHRLVLDLPRSGGLRCYEDFDVDTNSGIWKYGCEELEPLSLLEHTGDRNIILYPNPAQEWISLEYPEGYVPAQYSVTDITGRLQPVPMRLSAGAATFDLRSLPPGVYFVRALWPDGSRGRAKFVKSAY